MTVAERLFDELHAPDGAVPTLDDYTAVLQELREQEQVPIAVAQTPLVSEGLVEHVNKLSRYTVPYHESGESFKAYYEQAKAQGSAWRVEAVRTSPYLTYEPARSGDPFLHYDGMNKSWVVIEEHYPLQGFVVMRAPDGQSGYVFRDFVDAALALGAVKVNG